jgi:5-methyltetrahydropteroyltriglutamate--homocysteine methyltransferase
MNRILTTHAGSLVRPPEVVSFLNAIGAGQDYDEAAYADCLRSSVSEIVKQQIEVGLDVIDDGEIGKVSWITYLYERVSGLELRNIEHEGSMLPPSRDRQHFPGAYARQDALDEAATRGSNAGGAIEEVPSSAAVEWVCTGPMNYDRTAVDRDIANLKAAIAEHGGDETQAFLPVVAPASAYWLKNEHFEDEEAFVYGLADALHEEYKAIADSGLLLQVDDAVMMHECDSMLSVGKTYEDYRAWAELRVRALNHALRGIPEDRVRYHVCWGSWHGPHAYDPPLRDTVDLLLAVNAGYYSIEQANPRHEHEWRVWEDVKLPEGRKLIPGVVTHHTNVVEHPELVAQRLTRLANVVGGENVIGGTDCGFAQGALIERVHPEIQWAKLAALAEGAKIASRELWGAKAAA